MTKYRWFFALVLSLALLLSSGCGNPGSGPTGVKAAIIDQLFLRQPNPELISRSTQLLESAGFQVDVWQGDAITVDFYRKLPSMGYRLIILRVHSGTLVELQNGQAVELPDTYLFTAEEYTTGRYVNDQLTGKVSYAVMEEDIPEVFAVNAAFIKSAKGAFDGTVILAMGCESYRHDDLQQAFMAKGAAAYIGWSDLVSLDFDDKVMLDLLKNYTTANMTIGQGITATNSAFGNDPFFGSYLKFYPPAGAGITLLELRN